jgi:hypothetical protein
MKVGLIWLALVVALCVYAFQNWPVSYKTVAVLRAAPPDIVLAPCQLGTVSSDGRYICVAQFPILHESLSQPSRPWLIEANGIKPTKPRMRQICGDMFNAATGQIEGKCVQVAAK